MRLTEFWERMDEALGADYARYWADSHVLAELAGMTANEALRAGLGAKEVWRAVFRALELPPKYR